MAASVPPRPSAAERASQLAEDARQRGIDDGRFNEYAFACGVLTAHIELLLDRIDSLEAGR